MTEKELRESVATALDSYYGLTEGGTLHKQLISIFNSSGLCTRYTMTTSDAWCAMAVSDAFIIAGLTCIFPCVECSCSQMITKAKSAGIWVEDDSYTPSIGDVIMYDWQDTTGSSSDNTGTPDHTGIIKSISGTAMTVVEGNYSDTVKERAMTVNGSYIRGYITPDYASAATDGEEETGYPCWVQDSDGNWYYRLAEGTNAYGWQAITNSDGKKRWYYFDEACGAMVTDWQYINGEWYYFQPSGTTQGALYHTDDNGVQKVWELE